MYWSVEVILAVVEVVTIEEFALEASLFVWAQSNEEFQGLRYRVPHNL